MSAYLILKKTTSGPDVLLLQQGLLQLGYDIIIDGVFGTATQQVVIRFQVDNNLAADGIVGLNTWAVINDLIDLLPVFGIDVSHHNGIIDWTAVPINQAQFVFCKASQGMAFQDPMMKGYMNELKRLGFIRGVYHFFTFMGVTGQQQIDNFINADIDFSQSGTLPPVLDIEWQQSPTLNQYILDNREDCIRNLQIWLMGVETITGRKPIIYTNGHFWNDYLGNPAGFESYPLWVAEYNNNNSPKQLPGWEDYLFWQYTESSSIAGIQGNVDKNKFNGSINQLRALALLQ